MKAVLAIALFFSLSLVQAADEYSEIAGAGFFINSVPPGAKVFIDGVERGKTPYSVSSARTGDYDIRITKDGYVERRFRIVLRRNSRVEVTVDLEEARGQVLLEIGREPGGSEGGYASSSEGGYAPLPFDPQVIAGGSRIHLTQTASGFEQRFSLPEGWQTLTVDAFGWERQSKNIYVSRGTVQNVSFVLKPAAFALHNAALRKKRFNPRSAVLGRAEVQFEVSAPGRGLLEVLNEKKEVIYSRPLGTFTARQQQAVWNGRREADAADGTAASALAGTAVVPDGVYTLRISVWQESESRRLRAEFPVSLDSSIEGRPLTLAAPSPGLLFAPSAEVLPAFSYQIEGALMAGKPLLRKSWESLPFAAGLRLSFTDRLEAAAAFNAAPGFSGDGEWGIGASAKWVFFKGSGALGGKTAGSPAAGSFLDPLGMAAELSYGWAADGPYTPFGMGTGAALRIPLTYRLFAKPAGSGDDSLSFDLLASPLVLWAGFGGYPQDAAPRLGIEGGTLLTWRSIAAGLSLRWDYAPSGEDAGSGPLVSALECKFFPSNFVISALGGFWYRKGETGGFFGAGFGIMY